MPNDFATKRAEAVEPGRLRRAIARKYDRLGPGKYIVEGRHEKFYYVDLSQSPSCTCRDTDYRGVQCLHTLRAKIVEQSPDVWPHVLALAEAKVAAEREQAGTRPRRRRARTTQPTEAV